MHAYMLCSIVHSEFVYLYRYIGMLVSYSKMENHMDVLVKKMSITINSKLRGTACMHACIKFP